MRQCITLTAVLVGDYDEAIGVKWMVTIAVTPQARTFYKAA